MSTHFSLESWCLILSMLMTLPYQAAGDPVRAELVEVRKIWDAAPHNAFTDLVRFRDQWWCVFREGKSHVSPDGALRVIRSKDGQTWESAALITDAQADLRDAKITVTPQGRLMLSGAAARHKGPIKHQSMVWLSEDGLSWSKPTEVGDPDNWLWRVTWHDKKCFGVGYSTVEPHMVRMYSSEDGQTFQRHVDNLQIQGYPNESSILFKKDGTALCLLRRDPQSGLLGTSKPPYKDWNWKDSGTRIGGPHMIQLPDRRLIAVVRLYDKPVRTSVCQVDEDSGKITEVLKLPSGGDTSYAGIVLHDNLLRISYYSSHEKKTCIYLATVKIQ